MAKHTVVILQDNLRKAEDLASAFNDSDEFIAVGSFADGESGFAAIESSEAEFCVMDLILQNLDGLGVLDKVRRANLRTKCIIFSALSREEVIDTCMAKGASYYVTKPCETETLIRRIKELFIDGKDKQPARVVARSGNMSIDERISRIFISVGIPPHIKGYGYLREGIKLAVESPDVINNITKKLYPMIGEKYATTPSKVERAIRHAIEVAWARGRINNINDLFGVQTYLGGEKPTNGEFIALIADKMLLEGA